MAKKYYYIYLKGDIESVINLNQTRFLCLDGEDEYVKYHRNIIQNF